LVVRKIIQIPILEVLFSSLLYLLMN